MSVHSPCMPLKLGGELKVEEGREIGQLVDLFLVAIRVAHDPLPVGGLVRPPLPIPVEQRLEVHNVVLHARDELVLPRDTREWCQWRDLLAVSTQRDQRVLEAKGSSGGKSSGRSSQAITCTC